MPDHDSEAANADIRRQLVLAEQALDELGAGARANLECRVADLQTRYLSTRACSLDDVADRLQVIRGVVERLGPRGYLLDLVDAAIEDVRDLQ
jgi:hypothetical protein